MNEKIFKEESLKCLGCHSFKLITEFGDHKNGSRFKTCNKCRDRNKNRVSKKTTIKQPQPVEIALSEEEIEQLRISDIINNKNLILTAKSKNMFFRTLLTYTHSKGVKVEMISGRDIYYNTEIIKLIFSLTRSMIIIKWYDNWCKIKRLIDEELKTDKSAECSICFNSYTNIRIDRLTNIRGRMSCIKCYNDYCINCFLKLYEKHQALILCPYCRDRSGEELDCYGCGSYVIWTHFLNISKHIHADIPFSFSKAL
jgi:hypothetical protein